MWERRSYRVAVTGPQEAAIWDPLAMLIITHVNYYSHGNPNTPILIPQHHTH